MLNRRGLGAIVLCAGAALVARALVPSFSVASAERIPSFRVPPDNPMTPSKVRLGRFLFYDRRLSINGTISCADCHRQEAAFADPRAHSVGATGAPTTRNAMTLTNVAYNGRYTWVDDTITTLEQQARVPLLQQLPLEMGVSVNETAVVQRFQQDVHYQKLFADAFPDARDAVTLTNTIKAISSFERTLISLNAPYDRFIAGDVGAITASAQRGLALFRSDRLKCVQCHDGFNFRQTPGHRGNEENDDSVAYHNTGLYGITINVDAVMEASRDNARTDASRAAGRFKAPTLRNIAVTAPYMHDGSVGTLDEVIDIYAAGGRVSSAMGNGQTNPYKSRRITGFTITRDEKRDLIAFLESLTDRTFLSNPNFGNPFASR
jgi:cytochrome c peroxidase